MVFCFENCFSDQEEHHFGEHDKQIFGPSYFVGALVQCSTCPFGRVVI